MTHVSPEIQKFLDDHGTASKIPSQALAASRVDLLALIENGIPPREYVPGSGGVLVRGKRHHIAAPAKSGKSITIGNVLAVDVVAAGGTVVVFDGENGAEEYARRLQAVLDARGASAQLREAVRQRYRYHAWPDLRLEWRDDPTYPEALAGADLGILDSSRKFLTNVGLKEDSSDDFSVFTEALIDPLMRARIATAVLDNEGHEGGRARGTSSKKDLCDVMFKLAVTDKFNVNVSGRVELTVTESRIGELTGPWTLELGGGSYGSWRHLDGTDAHQAFTAAVVSALRESNKKSLGGDALINAARKHGVAGRTRTLREWLADLAAQDGSPITHDREGYTLTTSSRNGTSPDDPPRPEPRPPKGETSGRGARPERGRPGTTPLAATAQTAAKAHST